MKLVFHGEEEPLAALQSSLHEWLKRSDRLVHSHIELVARPGAPGEMGGIADLVLNLNVVEVTAAVSAIMAWLRFRGADIDAERTADGNIKIRLRRIRHRDVRETEKLLTDLIQGSSDDHQNREDQRQ